MVMFRRLYIEIFAAVGLIVCLLATSASCHPHIIANVKMEILQATDGSVSGIRVHWGYDAFYSAFVKRMADQDRDGRLSKEELDAFAGQQIGALGEFSYYTRISSASENAAFVGASDYSLMEGENGLLFLSFTIKLKKPMTSRQFEIDVFDPDFFAYFTTEKSDGIKFEGSTLACAAEVQTPPAIDLRNTRSISAAFWSALDGDKNDAKQFINRINVSCR